MIFADMPKRLYKRLFLIMATVVIVASGAVYGYILPASVGRQYMDHFYIELAKLESAFVRAASSGNMTQFSDPDVPLVTRFEQTREAMLAVAEAKRVVTAFETAIDPLPALPLHGWYGDYQTAALHRQYGKRIALQGREVLAEYDRVLAFLSSYTALQHNLEGQLLATSKVDDFDTMGGRGPDMATIASSITADTEVLRNLDVPKDFAALQAAALDTFTRAASGYDQLADGLNAAVNSIIYDAAEDLAAVALKNDTTDRNLLVALVDASPIFSRLNELPEKVDYAEQ